MDYEKKYKEALEKAQRFYNNSVTITKKGLEEIFPELKESENEKMRKHIIEVLKDNFSGEDTDRCITWLEKQGEQKSIWHNEDEEPQRDSLILLVMQSGTPIVAKIIEPNHTFNHGERWAYIDDLLEKQGEQNPTEEYNITGIGSKNAQGKLGEMIKNLKPVSEVLEQKSAWSEEDEEIHRKCICAMRASACGFPEEEKFVEQVDNWLKCLKARCAWKPSDEQMDALHYVTNFDYGGHKATLVSLYEQLKKLKG